MPLPIINKTALAAYDCYNWAEDRIRLLCGPSSEEWHLDAARRVYKSPKLAFVCPTPGRLATHTFGALMRGLETMGYIAVVAVVAKDLQTLKSRYPSAIPVQRPLRAGRDFGVWKHLILDFLAKSGPEGPTSHLLLVNDSLFYNDATADLLAEMESNAEGYSCLFESFRPRYHPQSFFLLFSSNVFRAPSFKNYWQRYAPYESRNHVIKRGEVAFGQALLKHFGLPYCVTRCSTLADLIRRAPRSQLGLISASLRQNLLVAGKCKQQVANLPTLTVNASVDSPKSEPDRELFLTAIDEILIHICENSSPVHGVGLTAHQLMRVPIKRDVVYRRVHLLGTVLSLATHYLPEEKSEIAVELSAKGHGINWPWFKSVLYRAARI
jgi:hypothetical protein